jgi:hypothetical protein
MPAVPTVSIDDLVASVASGIGTNSPGSARRQFEKKKKTLADARKIERKVRHRHVHLSSVDLRRLGSPRGLSDLDGGDTLCILFSSLLFECRRLCGAYADELFPGRCEGQ